MILLRRHNRGMSEHQRGFTLVEFLMAAFVSSVLMTVIAAIFARSLGLQRQGFFAQKVQENTMYILERMAKEIRVSEIGLASENISWGTNTDGCGNTSVTMVHPINGTIVYSYNAALKNITRQDASGSAQVNSDDVQFNRISFCLAGASKNDKQQVRLSTIMQMQARDDRSPAVVVFNIQTTVTSRNVVTEFQY